MLPTCGRDARTLRHHSRGAVSGAAAISATVIAAVGEAEHFVGAGASDEGVSGGGARGRHAERGDGGNQGRAQHGRARGQRLCGEGPTEEEGGAGGPNNFR